MIINVSKTHLTDRRIFIDCHRLGRIRPLHLEEALVQILTWHELKNYLFNVVGIGHRWTVIEPVILNQRQSLIVEYAMLFIGVRWPEAEPYIIDRPSLAYDYAVSVLKRRWPEAEEAIMKDEYFASRYAKDIVALEENG